MTSLVGNTPYPGDKFIAQEYAKKLYNEEQEEVSKLSKLSVKKDLHY